jgi:cysteine desulfurase
MSCIRLDANATRPLLPEAWEAMHAAVSAGFGNASSAHSLGRAARQRLEDSRERIAALLDASPDEVIFTSGATEANNLALFGLMDGPHHVIASPIEHPCVIEPLRQLQAGGAAVDWLPVSKQGIVPAAAIAPLLRPETRIVTVMLANHETGAIQPVKEIAQSFPKDVLMHTDAAQAVGKMPVSFRELGVAALTASAHKFRGPQGIGLLLLKKDTHLRPRQFGGHQQQGRRPGTEPVVLAVGLAAALEHAVRNGQRDRTHLETLRARLWSQLELHAGPVVLNGPAIGSPDALPTTLNVSFPGCRGDLLLMALDLAGIACSTGSACSSGSLLPSPVLQAMGVADDVLRSAIRFSFGPELELAEVDDAAVRIKRTVEQVRESAGAPTLAMMPD